MQGLRNVSQLYGVALAVGALGAGCFAVAAALPSAADGSLIGPAAVPSLVGAILIGAGLMLGLEARAGIWDCEATDGAAPKPDLPMLGILLVGMVLNVALIRHVGFILASTLMYVLTARAFGARRYHLSAGIGFVLAFAVYFGFARLLELRIGGGLIEDLF